MVTVKTETGFHPLENRENFNIVYDYEGNQELSFDISPADQSFRFLHENKKLRYGDNQYQIVRINKRKTIATITALLDLNEWKANIYRDFKVENKLFSECMLTILPEGWKLNNQGAAKKRCSFTLEGCTAYDILMECKKQFQIVYEFHICNKTITIIDPTTIQQRGLYMSDELNLDGVEYKGDHSKRANRLYAYGKKTEITNEDGATMVSYVSFANINNGLEYVDYQDNMQDEIICAFWQEDSYEDPQALLVAAKEKIKLLGSPTQSWSCNLYDLSRTNEKYQMLDFKLYDKVMLLLDGQAILHQIVEYTDYPDNRNMNKVVLSTVFKKIEGEISSLRNNIMQLEEDALITNKAINEVYRDVNSNSLLIKNTYRKNEIDTKLSAIIQQTDTNITASVSAVNKKVEVIEEAKRYSIQLDSSKSTIFRNVVEPTVVTAHLFSWDDDISTIVSNDDVRWERRSLNSNEDSKWQKRGKEIIITSQDIKDIATFECIWKNCKQTITFTVVYDGEAGVAGTDGTSSYFHIKYAPVANPSDQQMSEIPNKYIGTYVDHLVQDSTVAGAYTWSKFQGSDGTNGIAGKNGADGKTAYLHICYSDDGGKTFTANNGKTPGAYIGQYSDFTQKDSVDTKSYTWTKVKGEPGAKGDSGVGISTVEVLYYLSTSSTALAGGAWTTTAPAWVNGKFMWSKTKTTLSNATVKESSPVCITGSKGQTGNAGTNGKGVTSIVSEFYLSTSKTTQTGGTWSSTSPIWTSGKYLWTRSKITYTNPVETQYTTPVCDTSWEAVNELESNVNDRLNETVAEITESYNSAIDITKEAITSLVESDYTTKTETETLTKHMDTRLDQTAEDFTMQFQTTQELISSLDGKVDINQQNIQKFIRFIDGRIELGQTNSKFSLIINNEKISFLDNGKEVAYISNSQLYITDANITNSLRIGKFSLTPRANGNMSIKLSS